MRRFRLATAFFFLIVATTMACKTDDDCEGQACCDTSTGTCTFDGTLCDKTSSVTGVLEAGNNVKYVNATLHSYNPEKKQWDLKAANASCWKLYNDKPLAWRNKYNWAGFSHGPKGRKACGKCIEVTNAATKVHEIVRIVDKRTKNEGLVLDTFVFQKLDGTGQGKFQGHLLLEYKFVDCKD